MTFLQLPCIYHAKKMIKLEFKFISGRSAKINGLKSSIEKLFHD